MNEIPKRAYRLTVNAEGDTPEDVADTLRNIADQIDMERYPTERTAGSPTSGYHAIGSIDETQTHDRYFEQLNDWRLERRRRLLEAQQQDGSATRG